MQQYCSDQSVSLPRKRDGNRDTQEQWFRRSPTQPNQQTTTKYYQYQNRMSSTSEDEATIDDSNENTLKKVKNTKRRKVNQPESQNITLTNKYSQLAVEDDGNITIQATENKIPKPPPIFVYGVTNYQEMVHNLHSIVEMEQHTTKTLTDNTVRINSHTLNTYRKLVSYMREMNIIHHTYQPKDNRAYRVVIKHLHHSTNLKEIEQELNMEGHKVRNILNARSRLTKEPLKLFFVDLEPATNNKDIYNIVKIQKANEVEPPRKNKGIPQCMRCQQYGHTKSYCNGPYACVKCGGSHST
jgi:hypothetical protein